MKRVIIVGAGAQAVVLSGVLARAEDVREIVLADIDLERARAVAHSDGGAKVRPERLDASRREAVSARLAKGRFDLLVNATLPMYVRPLIEACLQARTAYLDMASNEIYPRPGVPVEQLAYAAQWERAGLPCLTGAGGDPGLSNIMAKDAVLEMEEVDAIRIKDYGVVECDHPVALWSMRTYLEDLSLPATIWEDGQPRQVAAFSGAEDYDFPPPLSLRGRCYHHDHEESVTIPLFCGKPVRYCDFKLGEPDIETWRLLIQGLGLMGEKPVALSGGAVSPREVLFRLIPPTACPERQGELYASGRLRSRLMLVCDVTGRKDGKPAAFRLWTDSPSGEEACRRIRGASDVSWLTAVPAAVFALMLLRGQVRRTGVFPPEVFDREQIALFYRGLKEWGITVTRQLQIPAA